MQLSVISALWFAPFVLPVCLYVGWMDMRAMRIPNGAVMALAGIFVVVGLVALPLPDYPWRLAQLVAVLLLGIVLNALGAVGAGDAKFAAAAAPFVDPGDLRLLIVLFSAVLLAAFVTHRGVKYSALRRLAPHWESWQRGRDFPMGLALGGTLALYLLLGVAHGA